MTSVWVAGRHNGSPGPATPGDQAGSPTHSGASMIAGYLGSSDKTVMSCIQEAISFQVLCAEQDEVDYDGGRLSEAGHEQD